MKGNKKGSYMVVSCSKVWIMESIKDYHGFCVWNMKPSRSTLNLSFFKQPAGETPGLQQLDFLLKWNKTKWIKSLANYLCLTTHKLNRKVLTVVKSDILPLLYDWTSFSSQNYCHLVPSYRVLVFMHSCIVLIFPTWT